MASEVTYEVQQKHIGVITLNRPTRANAMSLQLLKELQQKISEINNDSSIRCVLITGAGKKVFCAGADLKERKAMSEEEALQTVQFIGDTISQVADIAVPTVAVMNGIALGGGLELALACDIRIAAHDISVGLTETSLGIIPGAGGTQRLARLIGLAQAKRLIFTAKPISSKEAYRIGLVEEVVHPDNLFTTALEWANLITDNAPIAVKSAKEAIDKGINLPLSDGLVMEREYYKRTINSDDRLEGLRAFAEKRKPNYVGK